MGVEVFALKEAVLGESPCWSIGEQALYWLDIGRKRLYRQSIDGQGQSWELPGRPGCVDRVTRRGLLLTYGEGVHCFDTSSGGSRLLSFIPLSHGMRFNEGKSDSEGRLWFGSMQDNFGPSGETLPVAEYRGSLFRFDPGDSVTVVEGGVGIPNSLAWSPDETLFYFADSLRDRIFVYDYDVGTGNIARKRMFFEGVGQGVADGSAVDVDGCLWNARWGAGVVLRITPSGRVDRRIELPVPQPSSCAFGGPDLDTLFVTSARIGLAADDLRHAPLSGCVFAITAVGQGMPSPLDHCYPP